MLTLWLRESNADEKSIRKLEINLKMNRERASGREYSSVYAFAKTKSKLFTWVLSSFNGVAHLLDYWMCWRRLRGQPYSLWIWVQSKKFSMSVKYGEKSVWNSIEQVLVIWLRYCCCWRRLQRKRCWWLFIKNHF